MRGHWAFAGGSLATAAFYSFLIDWRCTMVFCIAGAVGLFVAVYRDRGPDFGPDSRP